jgi:hypothetical protein
LLAATVGMLLLDFAAPEIVRDMVIDSEAVQWARHQFCTDEQHVNYGPDGSEILVGCLSARAGSLSLPLTLYSDTSWRGRALGSAIYSTALAAALCCALIHSIHVQRGKRSQRLS